MKIFYHCWSHEGEIAPYKNIRTPVILSIATLRDHNPNVPVCVLDCSEFETDWGNLPLKLNFELRRIKCYTAKYFEHVAGWKHLSRIFDLFNQPEQEILYIDSDCFFFKDPFPLSKEPNKFCWDGWNSGIFYLDKSTNDNKKFFDIFSAYTISAIYSNKIRELFKQFCTYDEWYEVWDEMILCAMKHEHPELFNLIDISEHVTYRKLKNIINTKIFHSNGIKASNILASQNYVRGILCLLIKELWESVQSILPKEDIDNIFDDKTINFHIKYQKEFSEFLNSLNDNCPSTSDIVNLFY